MTLTVETEVDASVQALIRRVGDRVRAARKDRGLSRRALSERSGVSPRYLAQLEGGEGNISIGLLKRIAIALDQSILALAGEEDPLGEEAAAVAALYRKADPAARARVLHLLDPARLRERKAERICLVGLRGAGKSTLGALIGAEFGLPFVELTEEIEKSVGMPIGEIIALYGQEGYRQLKASALNAVIAAKTRVILAVAGGIVAEPETFAQVIDRFHAIWLKASPAEHMERVRAQGDLRPMAGAPQAMTQLRQILKNREAGYRQAEHHFDTSSKTVDAARAGLCDLIRAQRILETKR